MQNATKLSIFQQFRKLSYNEQNLVLGQGCSIFDPENGVPGSAKSITTKFSLLVDGRRKYVCKMTFMGVYKISKHRISTVIDKMKAGDLSLQDNRGKHPKTMITDATRQRVRDHISSFPTMESHYGRNNGQNLMKYLEPGLNLEKLYGLFIEECRQQGTQEIESWLYRDVFRKDFKLSFSTPKEDTCDTCDRLLAQITNEVDQLRRVTLKEERDNHVQQSMKKLVQLTLFL